MIDTNMNNTDTISNLRLVGGNYFRLLKAPANGKYLKEFIDLFNFDDFWCYKVTNRQRLVTQQEFLEFKYSGYIFFKKELYDKDTINEWIDWYDKVSGIKYLCMPTPPFSPNKVIIREENKMERE